MWQHLVNLYNQLPPHFYDALLASPLLSALVQKIKNWINLQRSGVVNAVTYTLSVVGIFAYYSVSHMVIDWPNLLLQASGLASLIVAAYHVPGVGVKSISSILTDVKELRSQKATKLASDAEVSSVQTFDV